MSPLVITVLFLVVVSSVKVGGLAVPAPDDQGQSPAILPPKRLTFRVCGNFCGPDWCAGEVITEQNCVQQNIWQTVPAASGQVVDSCCRVHDDCCGKGISRPTCNTAIVACIQANKAYWSFCGAAVWAAMKVVGTWCCGSKCPTFTDPLIPLTLAGKSFTDGLVRISFTEDSFAVEALVTNSTSGALKTIAQSATCAKQSYALGHESLLVDLGNMMASPTKNDCGNLLKAASPSHEAHPLLDSPDTIMYWPHADVIAVNKHTGGVLQLERELN